MDQERGNTMNEGTVYLIKDEPNLPTAWLSVETGNPICLGTNRWLTKRTQAIRKRQRFKSKNARSRQKEHQ